MKTVILLTILMMLMVAPASAEFYRYTDSHGNTLYTDDLSKVPADQRQNVKEYEDAPTSKVAAEKPPPQKTQSARDATKAMGNERRQLEQQKKDLNKEYKQLAKERGRLDQEKATAVTPAQIKAYNQKIVDLNARINSYEAKRSAYTQKVKSFNDRVKAGAAAQAHN